MIKKNLFYNGLLTVSQFIFPLISFPYASRILGPAGIGEVNFIDSFTQYFIVFSALGIPVYGIREIAKHKTKQEGVTSIFNEIFFIHLISALLFSAVYLGVALSVDKLNRHLDLVWVGIIINISSVFSLEWLFQGLGQFSYITIRSLLVKSLSFILLFVFLKAGSAPVIYYEITASVFVLNAISNLFYVSKILKFRISGLRFKHHLKPLFVILGSTLSVSIYLILDNLILGFVKGNVAVGYYSTALRIVKIPFAVITAISTVIIPEISLSYHKQDFKQVTALVKKSFSFLIILIVPISVGLFVSSGFLVQTFAGEQFKNSEIILKILSPLVIIVGLNNLFGMQILTPTGQEGYLLRSVSFGLIASIGLNFLFVFKYSYVGSAVANIITEGFVTILCFIYAKKYVEIKPDWGLLLLVTIISSLFIPIAYLLRSSHYTYLYQEIFIIVVCAVAYIALLLLLSKNIYVANLRAAIVNKINVKLSKSE